MSVDLQVRRPSRIAPVMAALVLALALVGAGISLMWPSPMPVTVYIADAAIPLETRARRVEDVLSQLGVGLRAEDEVQPALDAPVTPGMNITVLRARPVVLEVAGRRWVRYTRARTVGEVLQEAGVIVRPQDRIWLGDTQVSVDTLLPKPTWYLPRADALPWEREAHPLTLRVHRAIPILVTEGGVTYTIYTTAATVGGALREAGRTVYLGDVVRPALGEPVTPYMRVTILRSTPVVVEADGRVVQTRTRARTVADLLAEQGIFLAGLDKVTPPLTTPLHEDMRIRVTRVSEFIQVEDERIPYETVYVPDDELEIDQRRLVTAGRPGIFRRRYRVRVEDGVEVSRNLEDAWVAQEPITNVIAYGRKIVTRTLETADGTIVYWRRIRMLATSYSASTAGVDPSRPWYGITRLGLKMQRGIVAVDPRVIPLGTKVYVPGYGKGLAADTGSRILGRRIDLGYNDWDLVLWNNWVDVYLLAPPPPKEKINYLLPNWPRPPR